MGFEPAPQLRWPALLGLFSPSPLAPRSASTCFLFQLRWLKPLGWLAVLPLPVEDASASLSTGSWLAAFALERLVAGLPSYGQSGRSFISPPTPPWVGKVTVVCSRLSKAPEQACLPPRFGGGRWALDNRPIIPSPGHLGPTLRRALLKWRHPGGCLSSWRSCSGRAGSAGSLSAVGP
jgi:hypothetical protein